MNIAHLFFSLDIKCPNCHHEFDALDQDYDNYVSTHLFNNEWDKIKGYNLTCTICKHEFEITKVEY